MHGDTAFARENTKPFVAWCERFNLVEHPERVEKVAFARYRPARFVVGRAEGGHEHHV